MEGGRRHGPCPVRRPPLLVHLSLALLSGGVAFAHARSADNFLVPYPPHSADATGFSNLNPGEVFDLGVIVESASRDTADTFHSTSLPRGIVSIILAVAADQPGVFVVGPITLHADAPAPLGIPNAIEMTVPMYGVLCIQISEQTCHSGYDAISKWNQQY